MAERLSEVQQQASSPDQSVWLAAHAGTGKTKVLVDRILRLLINGVAPGSVLAMTYTKAAAAEMQLRIRKEVARWASLDDAALQDEIFQKIQKKPSTQELERARGLLLLLTESRESLQIMTIHGFCQSLLMRFPLEAGLPSAPNIMDERQQAQLLAQAQAAVFAAINQQAGGGDELSEALELLVLSLGDGGLHNVTQALLKHAKNLFACWALPDGEARYKQALHEVLALEVAGFSLQQCLATAPVQDDDYPPLISGLMQGGKTDQKLAAAMQNWQASNKDVPALETYVQAFLKADFEKTQKVITQKLAKDQPHLHAQCSQMQDWAFHIKQQLLNERVVALSDAAAQLGRGLLAAYEALKSESGLLDFNDVISTATALLQRPGYCEWVLSKLDWQIGHVMLDEAQDTSPQQWQLVRILVKELFDPALYTHSPRSLFVVGDKKQSIYRFQGADPEGFHRYAQDYEQYFTQTQQPFASLTLQQSFRSTQAVLELVDAVCAQPVMQDAISETQVQHAVFRQNQRGVVSLYPLLEPSARPESVPPWELDAPNYTQQNITQQLAQNIAEDIAQRVADGSAEPADMLVLVQRRTGLFIEQLTRELQLRGVAVAGADRLRLNEHLAIKDVLALAQWCLLTADDLALATVLTGPLFGFSQEALFALAHGRGASSLYTALQADETHAQTLNMLQKIQEQALQAAPYDWLCYVLDECGMLQALLGQFGEEVLELVAELKRQVLLFESQQIAHLQGFVQWLQEGNTDIKREMQQGQNAVRIMTVHGAKGLQAPIVYLPDTVRLPTNRDTVISQQHQELTLLLVPPSGVKPSQRLKQMKEQISAAELAESYRLLYVALTRAENELVIMGYETSDKNKAKAHCWYKLIETALQQMGCTPNAQGVLRYENAGEPPTRRTNSRLGTQALPEWLHTPAPYRDSSNLPEIRSPSALVSYSKPSVADDAQPAGEQGRVRGDLTHYLLQILSDTPASPDLLRQASTQLMPHYADAESVIDEVLAVQQQHAWLFAPNTYAEVSVQGWVEYDGKPHYLRGQIDRLVISDTCVHVVDYKSNQQVPSRMPQAYAVQLAAYVALLTPLYPAHRIRASLLWTANARFEHADGAFLETLCKAAPLNLDSAAS